MLNSVVSPVLKSHHKTVIASAVDQRQNSSDKSVPVDSKFDLGLVFRPQNRSRISNAGNTDIFKLWDAQNPQKFGFIPLSDLTLPNEDK